jgi:DNA-binding beta-propeller fold protein YncE
LEIAWRLDGLADPESVALSADGTFLYVSNVSGEGEAKDGDGFIARVSRDGRMLERAFVTGLDAPKGLALHDGALYVADIDQVVVIGAADGAIRARIPAPGAAFLNDLAFTPAGQALIADSERGRIYALAGEEIMVWRDDPLLERVNGLLPESDRVLATTMAGRLLSIDYATRAIAVLAEGLGDADGIAPLDTDRYLVSEWPGVMHSVNVRDGAHATILDSPSESRFMNDFLRVADMLYQPHWKPGALTAYRIVEGR